MYIYTYIHIHIYIYMYPALFYIEKEQIAQTDWRSLYIKREKNIQ